MTSGVLGFPYLDEVPEALTLAFDFKGLVLELGSGERREEVYGKGDKVARGCVG